MFIDLIAAFLDDPFHFVGFCRRPASERAGESRFPFYLADRLEPPDETGGHFQPVRRKGLQILEDVFERAHNFKVHRHDPSGKQQYPRTMIAEQARRLPAATATPAPRVRWSLHSSQSPGAA